MAYRILTLVHPQGDVVLEGEPSVKRQPSAANSLGRSPS